MFVNNFYLSKNNEHSICDNTMSKVFDEWQSSQKGYVTIVLLGFTVIFVEMVTSILFEWLFKYILWTFILHVHFE